MHFPKHNCTKTLQWVARLQTHWKDALFKLASVTDTSMITILSSWTTALPMAWATGFPPLFSRFFLRKKSCKVEGKIQLACNLPQERESALIWIEQHIDFRWLHSKAWKWRLAWLLFDSNQSLQPNRSQMKCDVWKPFSDQRWQDELQRWHY